MTDFDPHGFYKADLEPVTKHPSTEAREPVNKAALLVSFWTGVELAWFGRDRNPEIPRDANDPEGCEAAYLAGRAEGRRLREVYR